VGLRIKFSTARGGPCQRQGLWVWADPARGRACGFGRTRRDAGPVGLGGPGETPGLWACQSNFQPPGQRQGLWAWQSNFQPPEADPARRRACGCANPNLNRQRRTRRDAGPVGVADPARRRACGFGDHHGYAEGLLQRPYFSPFLVLLAASHLPKFVPFTNNRSVLHENFPPCTACL